MTKRKDWRHRFTARWYRRRALTRHSTTHGGWCSTVEIRMPRKWALRNRQAILA